MNKPLMFRSKSKNVLEARGMVHSGSFRQAFGVFLISLTTLLINLGEPPIYILDEAKNAECAREMLVSGNYIVPQFNGQLRTDKPPLHYFFMVAAYKIFGVSSFSARFFSAVFGALTVVVTFLFAQKIAGRATAFLTALVLFCSLHFNLQMRLAVPDPYLIFFMTAGLMSFYLFFLERKQLWLYAMYISFALGFLTKGPVALVLPGLIICSFLIMTREFKFQFFRSLKLPVGILIFLLLVCPWYYANYVATDGAWTRSFFLEHNLGRYRETMEGHGGFFLLPFLMPILGLLPLSFLFFHAIANAWRNRSTPGILFCLFVVAGVCLFFSFSSTKLPNYTVPAYPFAAVLIAVFLKPILAQSLGFPYLKLSYGVYTFIALAIPIGIYMTFNSDENLRSFSYLALYFLFLPIGALCGWYLLSKRKNLYLIYTVAISFIITNVLFFVSAYPAAYAGNPVVSSLGILKDRPCVAYYRRVNPAYVFHLRRIIPPINDPTELQAFVKSNPRCYIISRKKYANELEKIVGLKLLFEGQDTFEGSTTVIYQAP